MNHYEITMVDSLTCKTIKFNIYAGLEIIDDKLYKFYNEYGVNTWSIANNAFVSCKINNL